MTAPRTATRKLLDRARSKLTPAHLRKFVGPSDPGWHSYLVAMTAILEDGEAALERSRYIRGELDFDEPIDCAQWDDVRYDDMHHFRWYRVMCAAAALLLERRFIEGNENYFLANLINDSFRLRSDAGDQDAPTDLITSVCREARANANPWDGVYPFTYLGELLMASVDGLDGAELDALCAQFEEMEAEACAAGRYVSTKYLWGLTFFNQLSSTWRELVQTHFPDHRPKAAALKRLLLDT